MISIPMYLRITGDSGFADVLGSHSDLHLILNDLPTMTNIPGHEGVGRVVKGISFHLHHLYFDLALV